MAGAGEKAVGCVRPHWGWLGPGGGGGSDAALACPDATWRCGEGSGAAIRRFYLLYTYIYHYLLDNIPISTYISKNTCPTYTLSPAVDSSHRDTFIAGLKSYFGQALFEI